MDWFDDIMDDWFGVEKSKSGLEGYSIPDFQEDPDYRETQDYLKTLGIDILGGNIPDYYKGIGEAGGSEFENYLNSVIGDVKQTSLETAAAMGRGGGAAMEIANEAVGPISSQARYTDFLRALEGKQWLFEQGKDITEGVRTSGQNQQNMVNTYGLNKANTEIGLGKYLDEYNINAENALGQAQSGMLTSLLTTGAGIATGNPGLIASGVTGGLTGVGGYDWDELFSQFKKPTTTTTGTNTTDIGKIGGSLGSSKNLYEKLFSLGI